MPADRSPGSIKFWDFFQSDALAPFSVLTLLVWGQKGHQAHKSQGHLFPRFSSEMGRDI